MDGILNVYKEEGFTSHDVVAKLRGILHQKKMGHTGTLDPAATGVLPVCCGKATKVCELLTDKDKTYKAVCRLGIDTDTQDTTGTVVDQKPFDQVTKEMLEQVLLELQGDSEQIPPMYSAIKIGGKKLYELAREGKTVERKPRKIHIENITLLEENIANGWFSMEVTCSKGTYIRTLCHDIGIKLNTVACMEKLVRTRVSQFTIEDALTLSQIEELFHTDENAFAQKVCSVESLFPQYDRYQVTGENIARLANGNKLNPVFLTGLCTGERHPENPIRVYDENGKFKAIYEKNGNEFKVKKMF